MTVLLDRPRFAPVRSPAPVRPDVLPRLARGCYRHRRAVVALWLAVLALVTLAVAVAGTAYDDTFEPPHSQSTEATALLRAAAPGSAGDQDQVVISVRRGSVTDPAVRAAVARMLGSVSRQAHVAEVGNPYIAGHVAPDGKVAFATVSFDVGSSKVTTRQADAVVEAATSIRNANLRVDLSGDVIEKTDHTATSGVGLGVALAGVVLLLAFGSLFAAALPLLTALVSLGTGIGLVGLTSHLLPTASFSSQLASLVGLGVGIDYALFIVTRHRQALSRGKSPEDAVVEAVDTAGRAVIFAGLTVCAALLGMFALHIRFLYGVAVASSLTVALTVAASVTFLPALLGFTGTRVLKAKERRKLTGHALTIEVESRGWGRWARRLQKRPGVFAGVAALLMVALAVPLLGIRLGSSDAGSDPTGTTTRRAYDTIAAGFGAGANGPLELVAAARDPRVDAAMGAAARVARTDPHVVTVSPLTTLGGTDGRPRVDIVEVVPRGAPQDAGTEALLRRLRRSLAGTPVLVGGETASISDFSAMVSGKLPWFIGLVVLVSSLLLMAVFRSLLIPLTAAVMNVLSAGAAFGVVTAVFQDGWGAHLIGVTRNGPIEAFVPVMMFAVLFGLSMDYEVFLISRIFEELHRRRDNTEAVVHGLAATGRTVSAAAAIMVGVFAAFLLGGDRMIKLFGVGLASAVALDAVVVRAVLVPAAMLAFGDANWRLPRWLDGLLPHVRVEGGHTHEDH